jgi:hypothetical protein
VVGAACLEVVACSATPEHAVVTTSSRVSPIMFLTVASWRPCTGNHDTGTIEPNPSMSKCWLSSALRTRLDKTEHMALFPVQARN